MKNLLSLILVFSSGLLFSQNSFVEGQVFDSENNSLEFVNVLLMSQADSSLYRGTISESDGRFLFENIDKGTYYVEASMVGLGTATSEVFQVGSQSKFLVPPLTLKNGIDLDEVVVSAKKPFIELKADKMIVNVANSSVNAGNSALEVLEKSPGVTLDNNNNISLRGKQGVLVTINGKNQYLSGDEIVRLLETMPSSNIENIEIITNPSAKYDAEGNSGIINIVLKRNENLGTNGNFSSTYRQGMNASHFHNLNLNNRSEKLNVFGNAEYFNWGWSQDIYLMRDIAYNGGSTLFDQVSEMKEGGDGYNVKAGMDWQLNDKSTFGLLFKRNKGFADVRNDNVTDITGDNMPDFERLDVDAISDIENHSNTYNLNFVHKLGEKGATLSFDTDLSDYKRTQLNNYDNYFLDFNNNNLLDPFYLKNDQVIDINILAATLDFEVPINDKVNVETGLKMSQVETESSTLFESLNEQNEWENVSDRSNDFLYMEDVYAAYVNSTFTLFDLMIQGGLRLEHTESQGISATTGSNVERSYTNLFPSLSISKQIGEQNNLSVTYSRRLERPNYKSLNPFEDFLDLYTFEKGNPFLNPQYSNSFGLNYALGNKLFVSANYSHTTDAISQIIQQNDATNTTFQTEQNLEDTKSASLTISAPKVWSEVFTSRINIAGFYNEFLSALNDGSSLDDSAFGGHFSLNNEIQLPKGINMEISGSYQTKILYGQLEIDPQGSLDIGFSKKILNGKGNLKLSGSDLLYTRNSDVSIDNDDINLFVRQDRDTRRVTLNFTYSFGNQKVKQARNRKTSSSEESERI